MAVDALMQQYKQVSANLDELATMVNECKERKKQIALKIHEETKGAIFKYEGETLRTMNKSDGQCFVRSATEKKSA